MKASDFNHTQQFTDLKSMVSGANNYENAGAVLNGLSNNNGGIYRKPKKSVNNQNNGLNKSSNLI